MNKWLYSIKRVEVHQFYDDKTEHNRVTFMRYNQHFYCFQERNNYTEIALTPYLFPLYERKKKHHNHYLLENTCK